MSAVRESVVAAALLTGVGPACDSRSSPTEPIVGEVCTGFGEWSASEYVLLHPFGTGCRTGQAKCSGFGLSGS